MKTFIKTLLFIPLLVGCQGSSPVIEEEGINKYSYDKYDELKIYWNDVFLQKEESYFVYVYSETCYHCNSIKPEMFYFIDSNIYPTYLVQFCKEIPVFNSPECSVGAKNIDKLWIAGTPTLIHIVNKQVFVNIAGGEKILNYIELFSTNFNSFLNVI